jgi:hypothetical protein
MEAEESLRPAPDAALLAGSLIAVAVLRQSRESREPAPE